MRIFALRPRIAGATMRAMDTDPFDRRSSAGRFAARLWRTMLEWHFENARAREAAALAALPRRSRSALRAMYVHGRAVEMHPADAAERLQSAAPSPIVRPWTREPATIAPHKTSAT